MPLSLRLAARFSWLSNTSICRDLATICSAVNRLPRHCFGFLSVHSRSIRLVQKPGQVKISPWRECDQPNYLNGWNVGQHYPQRSALDLPFRPQRPRRDLIATRVPRETNLRVTIRPDSLFPARTDRQDQRFVGDCDDLP